MRKLIAILIALCLIITPANIFAVSAETNDSIVTENTTITSTAKTPEEQAIEKILAHKKALGEEIPKDTRGLTEKIQSGSIYYIKNYFSGKYLNVHYGVDANGTNVYQWTGDSSTEQKFKVVEISPECYKIYAMCSSNGNNRVLDVVRNGKELASGQNVDIWTPVDHKAQEMILTPLIYDNIFHIQMKDKSNFYLTSYGNSNGTSGGKTATSAGNVFIKDFNINDNQQWQFIFIGTDGTPTEPVPEPSTPYGWLDEVTANGIRGWAWCENYSELALNISIKIYNSASVLCKTISLVANQYRQDVEASGFGTGYYGFHTSIDWSEFDSGTYTIRAYAGVNTPTTELHDSGMIYIHTNISDEPNIETLILNSELNNVLQVGSNDVYVFSPLVSGTYVVQTFGNADTLGLLNISGDIGIGNNTSGVRSDTSDGGGSGDNFKIIFYAYEGEEVEIKVQRGSQSGNIGNYSIKVHRAIAQIYSFDVSYAGYPAIDTTIYSNIPIDALSYYGYDVKNNENVSYQHILQNGNTGFQRINSEIVYFAGHGDTSLDKNFLIFNSVSSILHYDTMYEQVGSMEGVKIAVWANCFSSRKDTENDTSIAKLAYDKGAEVSIGWYFGISSYYAGRWTNDFFAFLKTNHTVSQAITYANSRLEDPNSEVINKMAIYGNRGVKIIPTTCPYQANSRNNVTDTLPQIKDGNYKEYNYNYGGKRYVRLINNTITNDFYQVDENGYAIKSENTFTDSEIRELESRYNEKNIYSQNSLSELKDSLNINIDVSTVDEDQEIYYKNNGKIYHLRAIKTKKQNWYIDLSTGKICEDEINFY